MNQKGFTITELLITCLIPFLIIVAPLIIIWSLNTLFALTIPFTIQTWFAVIVLGMFFGAIKFKFRK